MRNRGFCGYSIMAFAAAVLVCACAGNPAHAQKFQGAAPPQDTLETDDLLADKNPEFDPDRVDSRPVDEWQVNQSAAVIKLDSPEINDPHEESFLDLRSSYADLYRKFGYEILPSANMLAGAAKQFDDGLYAALDLACYSGTLGENTPGAGDFINNVFDQLPGASPARPFLGAALELAGKQTAMAESRRKVQTQLVQRFEEQTEQSKPISFYTWTPELEKTWKFYRFLQREFTDGNDLQIPHDIANAINSDADLMKNYAKLQAFYDRLTNPRICLPVTALLESSANLRDLAGKHRVQHTAVAVFPPATSRENELFEQIFPLGVPPNTDLMSELIQRIRNGTVDLQPKPGDGWYQYQIHALTSLLIPGGNPESERLLLTAQYKKRLTEAFKAMFTEHRETHARQLFQTRAVSVGPSIPKRPERLAPRFRIEPCPSLYLRTARAYAFLQQFLRAAISTESLSRLHGFKEGGLREMTLGGELEAIRLRFYGFYLIACEDIGMAPEFLQGEPINQTEAKQAALKWLNRAPSNVDLACDTRVAVPIYYNTQTNKVRLWVILGVRLAKLNAEYARPPMIRPLNSDQPWEKAKRTELVIAHYMIPVEDFAEIEIDAGRIPNRAELRAICDTHKTKEEIIEALQRR